MSAFTRTVALLTAGLLASPLASAGIIFGFDRITSNGAPAGLDSQLTVDVSDEGSSQVRFTFLNSGPLASSITDIFFDDGTLLGLMSVINGPGVSFTGGSASPGNLPAGNTIDFNTTTGLLADSDAPVTANGVNPGESVAFIFDLLNGKSYADTLAAMAFSYANPGLDMTGGLRIGMVVHSSTGIAESYVNNGGVPTRVPEPTSIVLLGVGLGMLGVARRRKAARLV